MKMMYVIPAVSGQSVPGPDRTLLPAVGAWVPRSKWWLRRLAHKDVIVGTPPSAAQQVVVAPVVGTPPNEENAPSSANASDEEGVN